MAEKIVKDSQGLAKDLVNDCISRKAAIDAIRASTSKYTGFMEMEMYTDDDAVEAIEALPSAEPECDKKFMMLKVIDLNGRPYYSIIYLEDGREYEGYSSYDLMVISEYLKRYFGFAQPDLGKYEYHYDHTDCIWYRPEARNRCPATCAQYRDGWNDAMNYIFRDGKGYRPYRRGEQYEE